MFSKILILSAFFSILSITELSALTEIQKAKIKSAYKIGKSIKASNGMTFENTLPSIMGQESSWGNANIGDKYDTSGRLKSLYDSSLGNFQIKLSTAKIVIMKYPHLRKKYGNLVNTGKSTYKEYAIYRKRLEYYKSVFQSKIWKKRAKQGNKKAIKTIAWAKKEFLKNYDLWKKASKQAKKDTRLINKLMYNFKFSAEIAGYYLLNSYEQALNIYGKKQAYWRAIGKYNGGWNNKRYYNYIIKRMKIVKKVVKK